MDPYFIDSECDVCQEPNWICPCGITTCDTEECKRCHRRPPQSDLWRVEVRAVHKVLKDVRPDLGPHAFEAVFAVSASTAGEAFRKLKAEIDFGGLDIQRTIAMPIHGVFVLSQFRLQT